MQVAIQTDLEDPDRLGRSEDNRRRARALAAERAEVRTQEHDADEETTERQAVGIVEGLKTGGVAADRLRSIIERWERLLEEIKELQGDIKDIKQEGRSAGFDVKVLTQIIKLRQKEPAEIEEQEHLLDLYKMALGM